MISDWQPTRLGSVARVKHGWAFAGPDMVTNDGTLPIVVGIGNFNYSGGFRFASTATKHYRGDYPPEYELFPGDVLLVMTCQTAGGEILGIPGTVPDDGATYLHNQRLGKLEVLDPKRAFLPYLFQVARWSTFNHHLFATASGSKILHTSPARIEDFTFALPPLAEQQGIAATLGALDDKVESQSVVNSRLEQIAQALFRSWFVEFEPWGGSIPTDWRNGCLSDVVTLIKRAVKAGERSELPYVPIDIIPMKSLGLTDFHPNERAQSSLITFGKNDILVGAMRVYFHRVAIAPFEGITRTTCFVLRPNSSAYLEYVLLLCNEDGTIAYAESSSKGSTIPYAVWDGGLAEMPVVVPPEGVAEQFSEIVGPVVARLRDGLFEFRRLRELRDTLLPELLSGRIRLREAEEVVA